MLPPAQEKLGAAITGSISATNSASSFNRLYVLTNMPIQRFGSTLISKGQFEDYMALLKNAYQPENLDA